MTVFPTPQVEMWQGQFGDDYTDRNAASPAMVSARIALWSEILSCMIAAPPRSILEVGANLGINLRALRALSSARFYAVEPNDKARAKLLGDSIVAKPHVRGGTASAITLPDGIAELTFTAGVLIHIHPDQLLKCCAELHRCSARWIACLEYFSDKPEMVPYRGQENQLFKRDFGSFWLDNFHDLEVVRYGFAWKRVTGLDNLTWWVFQKRG